MAWTAEQAAAYAAANPDVWKSYQNDPQNQGLTLQQAMEGHYNNFGQTEGRAAPTASQEYSTQNLSPYLSAGIQNSTKAYDVNGGMITLGAGQRVSGGSLNGNVIYNADGTSAGNYYTSPEEASRARAQIQSSIASGAVAGPQTPAQQAAALQNTLKTGGITSPGGNPVTSPGAGNTAPSGASNTAGNGNVPSGMIGATQTPWTVTSDQTVAGQAQKLMDPNNPLNVAAVANANMAANEKGLQNSSMAVTAGQQAVLDNALKIAGADAATNAAAAQSNATQANSLSATNATLANQRWAANLDATTKTNLAQIEANYKGLMQTSGSAADLWRSTMSLMGGVMTDPNMDSASKQNALNNMVASLSTGLQVLGTINGIDFGNLLQF